MYFNKLVTYYILLLLSNVKMFMVSIINVLSDEAIAANYVFNFRMDISYNITRSELEYLRY